MVCKKSELRRSLRPLLYEGEIFELGRQAQSSGYGWRVTAYLEARIRQLLHPEILARLPKLTCIAGEEKCRDALPAPGALAKGWVESVERNGTDVVPSTGGPQLPKMTH